MKTTLLKKLRRKAEKHIYVVYDKKLFFEHFYAFRIHRFDDNHSYGQPNLEMAKKQCDEFRRAWILEQARETIKPKRIY